MNRREALSATAALLGVTIVGSNAFLSGCSPVDKKTGLFTNDDLTLLDEITETILPKTPSSPGAKDAKVGSFIKTIVTDCYDEDEQSVFTKGLATFRESCQQKMGSPFTQLGATERTQFLISLDDEAKAYDKVLNDDELEHYFSMMKQLTIWGYFSSEAGATKAMRYVPVPGRYEGCIDYKKGEGAWVY